MALLTIGLHSEHECEMKGYNNLKRFVNFKADLHVCCLVTSKIDFNFLNVVTDNSSQDLQ